MLVQTIKDIPPAELTRCPEAVEGFPEDQWGKLTPGQRQAAERLADSRGVLADQLSRLIGWTKPGACEGGANPPY